MQEYRVWFGQTAPWDFRSYDTCDEAAVFIKHCLDSKTPVRGVGVESVNQTEEE